MSLAIKKNERARELIRENFGSQERFSYFSGIDEARLSKILRGFRKPTEKQKAVFERFLGVPSSELFSE